MGAAIVDALGNDLFAGTGFAVDHHIGILHGYEPGNIQHLFHFGRSPNKIIKGERSLVVRFPGAVQELLLEFKNFRQLNFGVIQEKP